MQALLDNQFGWGDLFTISFFLILLYFALKFTGRILPRFGLTERRQLKVKKWINHILLVYQPAVLLLLCGVFILINPVFHGLLIGLLLLTGFAQVKNYLSGRIVQFDSSVAIGKRLQIGDTQGVIVEKGRQGLLLKSNKGRHFVAYTQLLSSGYLMLSGREIGGYYHLNIRPRQVEEKADYAIRLTDLLASAPYLDWSHKTELMLHDASDQTYRARVLVKEENHLHDLVQLIGEWGYFCKITKK